MAPIESRRDAPQAPGLAEETEAERLARLDYEAKLVWRGAPPRPFRASFRWPT